jgi:hypothetical protein
VKRAAAALVLTLLAATAPARADDDTSTIVSELTVTAKPKSTALAGVEVSPPKVCLQPRSPPDKDIPAPKLVSSYPAKDQVVRPGLMVLRLTFDLPMACRGALGTQLLASDPCANAAGLQNWRLSYDRMHLRILCQVKPGKRYSLWINRHNAEDFQAVGGLKPEARELTFSVSNDAPVATVEEAVALASR